MPNPRPPDPRCPISARANLEEAIQRSANMARGSRIQPGRRARIIAPKHAALSGKVPQDLLGRGATVVSSIYSGAGPCGHLNFAQVRVDGETSERELPEQALEADETGDMAPVASATASGSGSTPQSDNAPSKAGREAQPSGCLPAFLRPRN